MRRASRLIALSAAVLLSAGLAACSDSSASTSDDEEGGSAEEWTLPAPLPPDDVMRTDMMSQL